MSNFTSFGGPSSYTQQQWPPSNPPASSSSMPSILPHNFPNPPDYSRPQDGPNNMNGFDANSRLPGLGVGAAGPLPPPPFPLMGPSQFPPPPFPPFQMPFLGYPPMQMPTPLQAQPNALSTSEPPFRHPVGVSNATGPQTHNPSKPRSELEQEEGEVTDGENWIPIRSENGKSPARDANAHMSLGVNGHKDLPHTIPDKRMLDVEEGEASSSTSSASSRASGSPYNPPMSVTADSPEPDRGFQSAINEETKPSGISQKENEDQVPSRPAKSPVQLRLQAQGALLSLAPHNIRYEELVREGINPVILRQLYEDVGIKVQTPLVDTGKDGLSKEGPIVNQNQSAAVQPIFTDSVDPEQRQGSKTGNDNEKQPNPIGGPPSASQRDANKPMERKEVIARMLAAKAAKTPGPSPSPQSNVPKETPEEPVSASSELPAKEKEVPVREKNKAQTELARKRIEELKKQGLMRNQQKQQSDSVTQEQPQRSDPIEPALAPPNAIPVRSQHPLPERPPQPEAPPARLPGLFMTDSGQLPAPESHAPSMQGLSLGPTAQPRVSQRKRPRASDFDEPSNSPREGFGQGTANAIPEERLVIDISDDEFYGDGENDHMDLETPADLAQSSDVASVDPSGSSTSVAPRVNDQEHIRKKDLEIQEMHRKIAELEQRKKTKLTTSRTQSPRGPDSSTVSLPDNPSGADFQPNMYSTETPVVNNGSDTMRSVPDTVRTASGQDGHPEIPHPIDPASMDLAQLAVMRSKILRKREIELGLPDLDAEIQSSEAKLSELQKDEEQLLLNIAKGKQGRQQLIGELEELGLETNGLTLEVLDAAQRKLESDKPSSPANQASNLPPTTCDNVDISMPDVSLTGQEESRVDAEPPKETASTQEKPQAGIYHAPVFSGPSNDNTAVEPETEASHAYESDSTGSSMDESSDSSSTGSVSDSQEELDEPIPSNALPHVTEEPTVDEQEQAENDQNAGYPSTLPENSQGSTDDSREEESSTSGSQAENDRQASRASSVASEAYEPPEPDPDSGSVGSEYTPPFSPVFPGPEESEMSPKPLPNQPQAEEPLTGKVQEMGADSRGHTQNVTDNQAAEHKFSPYKSPLRYFKAFRYHPNYPDAVPDGYRSLTYSHNIDPMKYLCPFEAAGGICNDRSCESQHFRDMTLSDDKILVQMGSLREGKTPEEKDQYITGLKQIINEMRRDKVKDFNTVATEIAAYRRRFLQDSSRVLPL